MLRNQDGWRAAPPSVAATSQESLPSGKPPTGAVRVRPVFAPRVVRRTTGNPAFELTRCSPERRYVRVCSLPMSFRSGVGTRAPRVPGGLTRMVTSPASRLAPEPPGGCGLRTERALRPATVPLGGTGSGGTRAPAATATRPKRKRVGERQDAREAEVGSATT
jgi:hypothetical protein